MADFENITGWREELAEYKETEEWKAMEASGIRAEMPLSLLYEFAQLLLKHEEMRKAMQIKHEWFESKRDEYYFKTYDTFDIDNDPSWPYQKHRLLHDFGAWFSVKSGIDENPSAIIIGEVLARNVLTGRTPSVRSKEAYEEIAETNHYAIDMDS